MTKNEGPRKELSAKYVGEINISDIKIRCAVLSDETRVFFSKGSCRRNYGQ